MNVRFVCLDTETSGLGNDAGVVEIAWAEVDKTLNVLSSVRSLINPCQPIQPSASGVHGITNADVADAPLLDEFVGAIFHSHPWVLIAHNAAFDVRFVKHLIPDLVDQMCTLKLARAIYPEADNHKLPTLRYYLNLDGGDAHSASGDVTTLVSLVRRMSKDTGLDLHGLLEMSHQKTFVAAMPFGKHKGTKLEALPRNYVQWLYGLDNLDDNLRYSLELTFYKP